MFNKHVNSVIFYVLSQVYFTGIRENENGLTVVSTCANVSLCYIYREGNVFTGVFWSVIHFTGMGE